MSSALITAGAPVKNMLQHATARGLRAHGNKLIEAGMNTKGPWTHTNNPYVDVMHTIFLWIHNDESTTAADYQNADAKFRWLVDHGVPGLAYIVQGKPLYYKLLDFERKGARYLRYALTHEAIPPDRGELAETIVQKIKRIKYTARDMPSEFDLMPLLALMINQGFKIPEKAIWDLEGVIDALQIKKPWFISDLLYDYKTVKNALTNPKH